MPVRNVQNAPYTYSRGLCTRPATPTKLPLFNAIIMKTSIHKNSARSCKTLVCINIRGHANKSGPSGTELSSTQMKQPIKAHETFCVFVNMSSKMNPKRRQNHEYILNWKCVFSNAVGDKNRSKMYKQTYLSIDVHKLYGCCLSATQGFEKCVNYRIETAILRVSFHHTWPTRHESMY